MPFRFLKTYDHRGLPVRYRDPMLHGSQLGRDQRNLVNRRKSNGWVWLLALLLGLSVIGQVVAIYAGGRWRAWTSSSVVRGAVVFVIMLVVMFSVMVVLRRVMWANVWVKRYLQVGRCPACQYSLAAIEPASDGCTVCPECGGAWRVGQ